MIDIKVTDSCGPTAVSRLHSDTTRHASHSHISRQSSLDYWGSPQGTPPPGVRMRLVTFVISAAGAISPDAQGLLAAVSRCSGGSLPSSLYPLSSWSASRLIPYVRQAVTFSVRRHLAACVRDAYSSAEAAPWLSPAQDALPPVPLLDSSDALDVVVAAPQGPACLVCCWCVRSPSRPSGSRVVPCWCCCRWSWCVRLSAPPCAPLFGPRVSAVRRPFPPCFIYLIVTRKHLSSVLPLLVDAPTTGTVDLGH